LELKAFCGPNIILESKYVQSVSIQTLEVERKGGDVE
jgi:hypothetical protein